MVAIPPQEAEMVGGSKVISTPCTWKGLIAVDAPLPVEIGAGLVDVPVAPAVGAGGGAPEAPGDVGLA